MHSRVGRQAASRPELPTGSRRTEKEPQERPSQGDQATQGDSCLLPQDLAIDFQYGREYAWMLNIFSVVVAYSITCPVIVPFGELSLRHSQGFASSDREEEARPSGSGHLLEQEGTWGGLLEGGRCQDRR